jgi:hypothetical protein
MDLGPVTGLVAPRDGAATLSAGSHSVALVTAATAAPVVLRVNMSILPSVAASTSGQRVALTRATTAPTT